MQACEAALAEAQRRGGNHVTLAAIRFEPDAGASGGSGAGSGRGEPVQHVRGQRSSSSAKRRLSTDVDRCAVRAPSGARLHAGQRHHAAPAGRSSRRRRAAPASDQPRRGSRRCWPRRSESPAPRWSPAPGARDVAPGHERHRDEGAAGAEQAREEADAGADRLPAPARPAARGAARACGEQHVRRRIADEGAKNERQAPPPLSTAKAPAPASRPPTTMPGAASPRGPSAPRRAVVCAHARQRREQDRRHRRGDRHLHRLPAVDAALRQQRSQTGTITMPPPMPSSPARKPAARRAPAVRRRAPSPKCRCQAGAASSRRSTACHSSASTGVIDSRLPRRSTCIVASSRRCASRTAAAAASCARGSRRPAASAARRGVDFGS